MVHFQVHFVNNLKVLLQFQVFIYNKYLLHCYAHSYAATLTINSTIRVKVYIGGYNIHEMYVQILQVHSNGYVTLQENQGSSSRSTGSSGVSDSGSKGNITTLFSTMDPLIGVFLTDVDTTAVGDVFYQYVMEILIGVPLLCMANYVHIYIY